MAGSNTSERDPQTQPDLDDPAIAAAEAAKVEGEIIHGAPIDRSTPTGALIFAFGIAFSAFQIYTAAYAPLSSLVVRSIHVGFLLLMTFTLCARMRSNRGGLYEADGQIGRASGRERGGKDV